MAPGLSMPRISVGMPPNPQVGDMYVDPNTMTIHVYRGDSSWQGVIPFEEELTVEARIKQKPSERGAIIAEHTGII